MGRLNNLSHWNTYIFLEGELPVGFFAFCEVLAYRFGEE